MTDPFRRFDALQRALPSTRTRAALAALALALLSGCGKKGPPLAPFSSVPAAPGEVTVRRKGDQVEIRFNVPGANSDGRRPARVDHVEVFGLTMPAEDVKKKSADAGKDKGKSGPSGSSASSGRRGGASTSLFGAAGGPRVGARENLPFRKYGTLVATVLVREPPPKPKDVKEGEPPPPPPPPRTDPGLDQGDPVLVVDTLTPQSLTPVEIPEKEHEHEGETKERKREPPKLTPPDLGPPLPQPSLRYYSVGGRNGKKKGPLSQPIAVPVAEVPPPPADLALTLAEGKINVAIVAPEGLRKPVLPYFPSPLEPGAMGPDVEPPPGRPTPGTTQPGVPQPGPPPRGVPEQGPPDQRTSPPDEAPVVPCVPASAPPPTAQAAATAPAGTASTSVSVAPAPVAPAPAAAAPGVAPAAGAPSSSTSGQQPAPSAAAPVPAAAQAGEPTPGSAPPPADAPPQAGAPPQTAVPCVPRPPTTLLAAKLLSPFPSPVYGYMVYEMPPPDFKPPVQQPGAVPPYPRPLTPTPVTAGVWSDTRFEVGVQRCYAARTVYTLGQIISESAATPTVCVKTVDTFPPAAPKNLQAVASEGTISLIWDANSEADLAGYIVLRGVAGSDKLTALTPTPIKESTYRDTKVKAGVRYVYAVVAADTATPQNVSGQSNRVEETAR